MSSGKGPRSARLSSTEATRKQKRSMGEERWQRGEPYPLWASGRHGTEGLLTLGLQGLYREGQWGAAGLPHQVKGESGQSQGRLRLHSPSGQLVRKSTR